MKASEIRQKTDDEILQQLEANRREIFQLRLKYQTSELKDTAKIGKLRKDIARLETEKTARAKAAKA
ncbi:MAG: 50S ribosomal protein L29 [Lentisphaeria bacterium]|nr:50S ribosomal protein L29 [Lentisphaeria bacterium]